VENVEPEKVVGKMKALHEDRKYRVYTGGPIKTTKSHDGRELYYHGYVTTLHGYVEVRGSTLNRGYTRMWFINDGWQYMRTWWRPYQPRYMVTLAKRFADDVVGAST